MPDSATGGRLIGVLLAGQSGLAAVLLAVTRPGPWWPGVALCLALPAAGLLAAASESRRRRRFPAPSTDPGSRDAPRPPSAPAGDVPTGNAPADTHLLALSGPVRARSVERRGGRVGVAEDSGGWFAVAELAERTDLRPDAARRPPVAVLRRIFQGAGDPSAVQVVEHILPGPSGLLPDGVPVVGSYRQLAAGHPTAAQHISWLCVRVDACGGAIAANRRGGGPDAAASTTASAMLRARRILRSSGFTYRILDAQELGFVLDAAGLVPGSPATVHDQRGALLADGLHQVCYLVGGEPGGEPVGPTLAAGSPAVAVTSSLTIGGTSDSSYARQLVRLLASADHVDASDRALREQARRTGHHVRRLDDRHPVAAYAAGPTAAALPPTGGYATAALAVGLDPIGAPWWPLTPPGASSARDPAGAGATTTSQSAVGLRLGQDVDQNPSVVRLFRRRPTEVVLVGGDGIARLLAGRALACGALVCVRTDGAAQWHAFAAASGVPDRVRLDLAPPPAGNPQQPTLIVVEQTDKLTVSDGLRPWQTRLTVLPRLTSHDTRRLAGAQLVVLGRLSTEEAEIVADVLDMTGDTPRALTRLPDEMVALVGGGVNSYVWLDLTEWERRFGGPGETEVATVAAAGAPGSGR
ncbi:hypothetical protein GCM10027280_57030 [Micromonospora polyrhachis]|uniref:Type VII secretion protein EccE n=1 Tax=Micromonospora polyrhachis TaxID=1282883 RepID=A0A7W7WQF3_9ACTN|nr:type VII secretion protein EccE [Micromonospora polyrhachis]MBB4960226.1 type VII secretion protein EccE [Micromonospora polyrhachis]